MEYSVFFYGYYNGTFEFEFDHVTFDYPLAYFLVMTSILLLNMAAIIIVSVSSMKKHIQRNVVKEDGHYLGLIPVIFGSWNFSETENVETQKDDVVRKILEMLAKLANKHKKEMMTADEKRKLVTLRIFINLTIIGLFAGLFFAIYKVYNEAPDWALNNQCQSAGFDDLTNGEISFNIVKCFGFQYLPSIVVTMANIVGPIMIFYLISYEKYEENTALLLSLGWCIFLR